MDTDIYKIMEPICHLNMNIQESKVYVDYLLDHIILVVMVL